MGLSSSVETATWLQAQAVFTLTEVLRGGCEVVIFND